MDSSKQQEFTLILKQLARSSVATEINALSTAVNELEDRVSTQQAMIEELRATVRRLEERIDT